MKKVFAYVPVLLLLLVLLLMDQSVMKWFLLVSISCLVAYSKYKRNKIQKEEIEYDDRVNANITRWSLRLMFAFNTMLIIILLIGHQEMLKVDFNIEMILGYLLLTLFIPFYVAPAIIKRY